MIYWVRQYFSRPKTHVWAALEVLITFTMAILPFVVAFLAMSAPNESVDYTEFWKFVDRGQLYLLSYGIFGPIVWLAFIRPDVARHNARAILGLIAIVVVFPVVGFLGVDPSFSTIQNKDFVKASYWFYGGFLVLNYLLIFYCTIEPPTAEDTLTRGSKDMRSMYNKEYGQ